MPPFKYLESEFPIFDSDFQKFCASHTIFSVEDLLMCDLSVLVSFAEQQPCSDRLKEGITQAVSIIDGRRQPWINGLELLQDAQTKKQALPTGYEEIDSLLIGGIHEGHLTELVGSSSSGKTQLCFRLASTVANKRMGRIIYVDTGNSFSPKRIAHFITQNSGPAFNKDRSSNLEKVMSSIVCRSVFNIYELFDVLHQLQSDLKSQIHGDDEKVRLLIVDSISSILTPILGGNGLHGRALMTSAGVLLKKLAHEHNIAAVVTNHTVGGDGGISKPALGESWKCIPHTRLLLSREHEANVGHISVLKHPSLASGKAARVLLHD